MESIMFQMAAMVKIIGTVIAILAVMGQMCLYLKANKCWTSSRYLRYHLFMIHIITINEDIFSFKIK